jgi:aminodeoxyfutalosine synthase
MITVASGIEQIISNEKNTALQAIGNKILNKQRINFDEGVLLFEQASLPFVGALVPIGYVNKNMVIKRISTEIFI